MTPVCIKRLSKGCFAGSPRRNPSTSTLRRPRSRPRIGSPLRLRRIDRWACPRGSRRHRSSHGAPSHAPIGISANRLPLWERQRLRQRRPLETLPTAGFVSVPRSSSKARRFSQSSSAGAGYPKKVIEKPVLSSLGSPTFSHDLDPKQSSVENSRDGENLIRLAPATFPMSNPIWRQGLVLELRSMS